MESVKIIIPNKILKNTHHPSIEKMFVNIRARKLLVNERAFFTSKYA